MEAECFADLAFDAISNDSRSRRLLGYSQAKAGPTKLVLYYQNGEVAIGHALGTLEHSRIIGRSSQAHGTWIVVDLRSHPPFNLGCQPGPTLRTSPRQHLTAAPGRHACPKTMGTLASDHTGLKSPLHGCIRPAAILSSIRAQANKTKPVNVLRNTVTVNFHRLRLAMDYPIARV